MDIYGIGDSSEIAGDERLGLAAALMGRLAQQDAKLAALAAEQAELAERLDRFDELVDQLGSVSQAFAEACTRLDLDSPR